MPTRTDYEVYDAGKVDDVIATILDADVQAVVGDGYAGIFEEGYILNPPDPSEDGENPSCWARYRIQYEAEPEGTFDLESDVTREGSVIVAFRMQLGAKNATFRRFFKIVREKFAVASDPSDIAYLVEGLARPRALIGAFRSFELQIRFIGA